MAIFSLKITINLCIIELIKKVDIPPLGEHFLLSKLPPKAIHRRIDETFWILAKMGIAGNCKK